MGGDALTYGDIQQLMLNYVANIYNIDIDRVVRVLTEADYSEWIREEKDPDDDLFD